MLALRTTLNYLLPRHCHLCGEVCKESVCAACARDFLHINPCRCPICGIELNLIDARNICGQCLKKTPDFDQTIVATDYLPPADELVHRLKFGHQLSIASVMADLLRDAVIERYAGELPSLLAPVPLGPSRLRERGFNQAQEITRVLAPQLGIDLAPRLLLRLRDTLPQSSLPFQQRQANTRNVFVCNLELLPRIDGQHIALVDDVMTTGTTLNEIAKLLKRHGARQVSNFVFARTPRHA